MRGALLRRTHGDAVDVKVEVVLVLFVNVVQEGDGDLVVAGFEAGGLDLIFMGIDGRAGDLVANAWPLMVTLNLAFWPSASSQAALITSS